MDTEARKNAPLPLYRADQVRAFDRRAIDRHAIPGHRLMTRAGAAAFAALRQYWPAERRLLVLCGGGNNAGDGYVVARLAHEAGYQVRLAWLVEPEKLQGDAGTASREALAAGVPGEPFAPGLLSPAGVVVDALLGTGLERPLEGAWLAAVEAVNQSRRPVLALDIPSGLQTDTGAVLGAAIRARVTITFIARKLGLFTGSAADHSGELVFDDLEVPATVTAGAEPAAGLLTPEWLAARLPRRRRSAHKGDFGLVLVAGGQPGMAGAALLAAEAAARSGAGLVSLATHPAHAVAISAGRPELMVHGVQERHELRPLLKRATVIALGPGLGQDGWGEYLWAQLVDSELPLVLDADGLNWLARHPRQRSDWILTPHPGEAARLLDCSPADIQADRPAAVRELQKRYGGVVVLKGAGSLIADGAHCWLSASGNPGMASGGMGDVLTGMVAALRAQGLPAAVAAAAGVYAHGLAADRAARGGERGLVASDLLADLRGVMNPSHD